MLKTIKMMLIGVAVSAAGLAVAPSDARAYDNDYCREYTRTVYIGGRTQDAYGQACLQPNGDWMIVGEGLGNDIPDNVNNVEYVIRDNNRYVTPTRVVYYDRYPQRYNSRVIVTPRFVWSHGGHYRGNNYHAYKPYKHHKKVVHHYRKRDDHRDYRRDNRHDNRRNDNRGNHYDPRTSQRW